MNKNNTKSHWQSIYTEKLPQDVSWFQQEPTISLKLIQRFCDKNAQIIDVGGGASVLVDHLLKLGYSNLAVLDISGKAIEHAKKRLHDQAIKVKWFEKDITEFIPPHTYDIWHDRAVFHFLTDIKSRQLYVNVLKKSIKPGAYSIIATFAKDGPTQCSGLDIVQYDESSIRDELGDGFVLLESQFEVHITPAGREQRFIYFAFQRK
ncbi:TPA: class I SAM-dependent methyltransferase [Legionella pneumophila]|nr:class I SAM-dependent methyltransferase [Legionella pneumophila]HAT9646390.1 methyltransferase [Legionella pneumophila subsp. pneumophila]HCP5222310.1 class I SAM-dependent methyltransferase [Legionella pneumophila]